MGADRPYWSGFFLFNLLNLIKMKQLFFICISLFFGSFYSCDKETKDTSQTSLSEQNRLRLDDLYSVIVNQKYTENELKNYSFEIVKSNPTDKYGVLELKQNNSKNEIQVGKFEIKYNKGQYPELQIQYSKLRNNNNRTNGNIEYNCECNDENATADDCVKKTYYGKLHSCDGNFCGACSLVVAFSASNDIAVFKNQSAIIFQ